MRAKFLQKRLAAAAQPLQHVGESASANAAAEPPADQGSGTANLSASVLVPGAEVRAEDLTRGGVHVFSAPGCVLKVHV